MSTGFLDALAFSIISTLTASPITAQASQVFHLAATYQSANTCCSLSYRYQPVNASLSAGRVVFMGDSITAGWAPEQLFLHHPEFLNRGVGGQTTLQMVARFETDVIQLKPAIVHIMGGTNDVAGNNGPESDEAIETAISSMVDRAAAYNIQIILAAIPPAKAFGWRPGLAPAQRIASLNTWLRTYAASRQIIFVDYWSAMADSDGGMNPHYSLDGVHPNSAGYAVMGRLLEEALQKAETQRNK